MYTILLWRHGTKAKACNSGNIKESVTGFSLDTTVKEKIKHKSWK